MIVCRVRRIVANGAPYNRALFEPMRKMTWSDPADGRLMKAVSYG